MEGMFPNNLVLSVIGPSITKVPDEKKLTCSYPARWGSVRGVFPLHTYWLASCATSRYLRHGKIVKIVNPHSHILHQDLVKFQLSCR